MTIRLVLRILSMVLIASVSRGGTFEMITPAADTNSLPLPRNHGGFSTANGYSGLITADGRFTLFRLFDSSGREILRTNQLLDGYPCVVDMTGYDNVVIVRGCVQDEIFTAEAYNYQGRKLMGPIEISGHILNASPRGKYYFENYDIVESCYPIIYDSSGQKMAMLEVEGLWKLTAVNDSVLLYQNGLKLSFLLVPEMTVFKEISFNSSPEPPLMIESCLSADGSHYAIAGMDLYLIYDFNNDREYRVPRSANYWPQPICLSDDGTYFVAPEVSGKGATVSLFRKEEGEYRPVIKERVITDLTEASCIYQTPEIRDGICIINYIYRSRYRSFIFRVTDEENALTNGLIVSGYSAMDSNYKSDMPIRAYLLGENKSGKIQARDIKHLDEARDK